jgi:hypothetical protein
MDGLCALGRALRGRARARARVLLLGVGAILATGVCLGAAAPAMAGLDAELAKFAQCPTEVPTVTRCVYSTTTGGEFHLGAKTVPIEGHTIVLQGGLQKESEELVPAKNGETVSKTPLPLPGGLIGVNLLPPLTEVVAIAEPTGPIDVNVENTLNRTGTAVAMPLMVKLENLLLNPLGPSCRVGSPAEPVSLKLTTGTTNPPPPNSPIAGSPGSPELETDDMVAHAKGSSLVDNSFAAPGANGCGEPASLAADLAVNLEAGLPSAAGTNTAILNGSFYLVGVRRMESQLSLPEVGRCVHAKAEIVHRERFFHGLYKDSGCTEQVETKQGEFEWEPGTGANKAFAVEGKTVGLETTSKQKITCLETQGSGEYTGLKSSSLGMTLTGCTLGKAKEPCETSGGGGAIVANGLSGTLGFIKDESTHVEGVSGGGVNAIVGWDISHGGSSLFTAQCGSHSVTVNGSVIAPYASLDKMVLAYVLQFKQSAGKQLVQSFEEQPTDTLSATIDGGSSEAAGLATGLKFTNGERLEVKGIVE